MKRILLSILLIICFATPSGSAPPQGGSGLVADSVGTVELDDGADTPLAGECVKVAAGALEFEYGSCAAGGSGSMTTAKESDVQVGGADIVAIDFGPGFDLAESPDTEVNITLDLTEKQVNLTTEVTGVLPNANVAEDLTITGGSVDNTTTITLEEQGAGDPTIDGRIEYDTNTETLKIGDDGAATLEFHPGAHTADTDDQTLDEVYDQGSTATVDTGTVALTGTLADNVLEIITGADHGNSTSTGGAFLLNNTGNVGAGVVLYDNTDATADGRLLSVRQDNALNDQQAVIITQDGTNSGLVVDCNTTAGIGDCTIMSSDDDDFTTLGISGNQDDKGTVKITHNKPAGADTASSVLSLLTNGAGTAAQGIFFDTDANETTGDLLNFRQNGVEKFNVDSTGALTTRSVGAAGIADADYGDFTFSSGVGTIDANAVALTTDTTGNYAAGDAEAGAALTGDSATSFFSSGEIADAQIVDDITASNYLPLLGGTLTGELVADELGIEFQPTDAIADCSSFAATGGGVFYDDSEGVLKKCQDNVLSVLDTTGGTPATADISDVDVTQTEFAELETIGATTISANQWAALGGMAETLTGTELNLLDGITVLSGSNTGDNDEVGTVNDGDLCVGNVAPVDCTVNLESELEAALDGINVLLETEIDASSELLALMDDETGSGLLVFGTSPTLTTPLFSGKIDGDAGAVNDDDCTGEQGFIWYDDTDSQWEACNDNSGTPVVLGAGGGGATDTTQRFPIQLKNPQTSSLAGNSFWNGSIALTAYDLAAWEFVLDVDGVVAGTVNIPNSLCSTPAAKIILQLLANATTGVTSLQVSTAAIADGESMNPGSLTAETVQDITVPATAYLREEVSFTLTNVPVAADILIVEVLHDGNKAEDTLAVNTIIESAQLEICVSN